MPKLFAIVPIVNGTPDIDRAVTPYVGYVLCDRVGAHGAYLISGTGAQLIAINALASVIGLVVVTQAGNVRWTELNGVISLAVRTKLNTFLTNQGYPTIPAGRTYRQVINAVFQRVNARFDLSNFDISES